MAISETSRHTLHNKLEEVLGAEDAGLLMEYLPPVGWADVATKRDLDHLTVATKRDLEMLELKLHSQIGALGHSLRTEMGELRTELRAEMGEL